MEKESSGRDAGRLLLFLPDLEPEKPESESQLSVLSHFHPKYFPS